MAGGSVRIAKNGRPLSRARREAPELCRLYLAGESIKALQDRFEACQRTVVSVLRESGVAIRQPGGITDATPEQIDEGVRLYLSGLTGTQAQNRTGIHRRQIFKALKARGLPIRCHTGRPKGARNRRKPLSVIDAPPEPVKRWCPQCESRVYVGCKSKFCSVANDNPGTPINHASDNIDVWQKFRGVA